MAALPAPLLFGAPLQRSLALVVSGFQVPDDTSWSFIVREYPGALWRVAGDDFESLTRSTPVTGVLVVVALVSLFALRRQPDPYFSVVRAAAFSCAAMILLQPNPTGLRLELVFVPVLAVGLALALAAALEWISRRRAPARTGVEPSSAGG